MHALAAYDDTQNHTQREGNRRFVDGDEVSLFDDDSFVHYFVTATVHGNSHTFLFDARINMFSALSLLHSDSVAPFSSLRPSATLSLE